MIVDAMHVAQSDVLFVFVNYRELELRSRVGRVDMLLYAGGRFHILVLSIYMCMCVCVRVYMVDP